MMQKIKGRFEVTVRGTPVLFFSKADLTSEKGNKATLYSVHIGSLFAFGITVKNKK